MEPPVATDSSAAPALHPRAIVVTGGSGFVGQHLLAALTKSHARMVGSFDTASPAEGLPEGVQMFDGSLEDPDAVRGALDGADAVVHLAAVVEPDGGDVERLWRVNVEGTKTVYRAAIEAGTTVFAHMSSAGVYGPPRHRRPFVEGDAPNPATAYQMTKWEAERALAEIDGAGTTLNVLRPAGIYGPGSRLELPQYQQVRRQRWVVELRGGVVVHPTYVDDVVDAILAILADPSPHRTVFNLGGERVLPLQELQALQAQILGVRRRRLVIPTWLAGPAAALAVRLLAHKREREPPITAMARGDLFSAAVDDRCLRQRYPELRVTPLHTGLVETFEWALARGLI